MFEGFLFFVTMATDLPSCFSIQFLEQLLKFLVNVTLLKYVKSQRSYGFLITKELIFGFQILDLKDHFSASLNCHSNFLNIFLASDSVSHKRLSLIGRFLLQISTGFSLQFSSMKFKARYPLKHFACPQHSLKKYV